MLRELKLESTKLLREVNQQYEATQDSKFYDEAKTGFKIEQRKNFLSESSSLHLKNEDKIKMMKSIIVNHNSNDLDFDSSVSKTTPNTREAGDRRKRVPTKIIEKHDKSPIKKNRTINDTNLNPNELKPNPVKEYFNFNSKFSQNKSPKRVYK